MWICKVKVCQKAKRDLQEAPTFASILLVVTILTLVWKLPCSAHREFGLCEFCSWTVCLYHLPRRNLLWKGSKDLQISRLLPLFLPSFTLFCIGSKEKDHRKKDCRNIFFDQEQHHMITLVSLHSLLFRRSLCTEEGNFIMIVCKDFQ